ncbi:VOC family protein [Actinoplanes teichomyceticus]|uniref:Glyoxalase-like domain-containing protein n=1 Tax=Actinoplanes teichomyceticus TaxID=1867 RepID=A0A561W9M2_ACTTI|nr:VOC family protein [Actinoplanes teichomyceticus]TWG20533.1 hypothetical protein FHX34_10361 [Actinoplanes teichomyceticus]GIF15866.1 hypothetical protein Ate01nite_58980 [Actinoplanes teichomyceticus]
MHRSRLYGLFIDTPEGHADGVSHFWAAALGGTVQPVPEEPEFTRIAGAFPGLAIDVQAVHDTARYHVDIETDNVDAETARLLALGAEVITDHGGHKILRAPGGHLLCVVPVQSAEHFFATEARVWA